MLSDEPYDASPKGIEVAYLDQEWGYAFDFAEPKGVVLLTRSAADRLAKLLPVS